MSKRKKIIFIVIAAALIVFAAWVINFYFHFLRGIWPAIDKPSGDIAKLIESSQSPLKIIPNFQLKIFAKNLNGPRVLVFDPAGNLVVSETGSGKVLAFNKNNPNDKIVIAENLNKPHGLAFFCPDGGSAKESACRLYVAETDKVSIYDYDPLTQTAANKKKIINLPTGGNHTTRTLLIKDNKLYISIGSSCNVCLEKDERRAKIFSANLDGSDFKEFAKGLRNSVFMAINPRDGKIWATEMGRDFLGDDLPPDEINIIEEGKNYGWPICYGKNIHDANFDKNTYIRNPCLELFETQSYIDIPAHSAPLGLAFWTADKGAPKGYENDLFVAYHGSWNRTVPTGYKIVRYHLDENNKIISQENFITDWLDNNQGTLGRPVGIAFSSNGIMYITDDKAGVIYQVEYKSE